MKRPGIIKLNLVKVCEKNPCKDQRTRQLKTQTVSYQIAFKMNSSTAVNI